MSIDPGLDLLMTKIKPIITSRKNLGLRNLEITQYYYDLSQAIAILIGQENANWCTFATWASKTAGTFIRTNDTLIEKLLDFFEECLPSQYHICKRVSKVIAKGNRKVFDELGPVFIRMVALFDHDISFDKAKLECFLGTLRCGATKDGGQDLLRRAVQHFYEAKFETEACAKAEKILLANAQVGLHEQTRLQDNIQKALDALPNLLKKIFKKKILKKKKSLADAFCRQWRQVETSFIRLGLPGRSPKLDGDLRPLPGQSLNPPELQKINNVQLRQLLEQYGALDDTNQDSGDIDWANLDQRMRFILKLFRSRQRDLQLFSQPFTEEQCTAISRGKIPENRDRL
jgi:hypothetical protein